MLSILLYGIEDSTISPRMKKKSRGSRNGFLQMDIENSTDGASKQ